MYETVVLAKSLTNVSFVYHFHQVRHKTVIKTNHTCKLRNSCNSIHDHKRNVHVENLNRVKSCKIKKNSKEGAITKMY